MRKAITLSVAVLFAIGFAGGAEATSDSGISREDVSCPGELSANQCEYFKDGFVLGYADAGMGMSMAYERHDGYDSTFEPYFERGYNSGWSANQ